MHERKVNGHIVDSETVMSKKYKAKHQNMKGSVCPKKKWDHGFVLSPFPLLSLVLDVGR